jgi:ABC-2 type transport system ATP-binding protein
VNKSYGAVRAVADLSLALHPGETVALLGPNGAGKSTALDLLLGLKNADSGAVRVFGTTPAQAIKAGRVGAMLQSGGLMEEVTVRELVGLACDLHPRAYPVAQVLAAAEITDIRDRKVDKLSGGQQQRVRFAMALVADPDLIVLDEPTTGLDVEARRAFWTAMRQETAKGRTVLFATHYLDEADAYADRIVLMRGGQIVADGTPNHIKSMVSGRTIRATVTGADLHALAALSGVDSVETRGGTVLLHCSDSDSALRALLAATDAHDVEVTARGLEDAFIALTTGPTAPEASAS